MDIRMREAIRYLGYGRSTVDEKTLQLMRESFVELEQLAKKKFVYRIFELEESDDGQLMIGKLNVKSRDLAKNLHGCKRAILFAATLGVDVDREIRKYEVLHISKAVVLQACAAAYLEAYCDEMQKKLAELFHEEGCSLRPRFSPGYGDFFISHQEDVLRMLEATKKIGLTMTEAYMLTPTKSVTAIIGVYDTKE